MKIKYNAACNEAGCLSAENILTEAMCMRRNMKVSEEKREKSGNRNEENIQLTSAKKKEMKWLSSEENRNENIWRRIIWKRKEREMSKKWHEKLKRRKASKPTLKEIYQRYREKRRRKQEEATEKKENWGVKLPLRREPETVSRMEEEERREKRERERERRSKERREREKREKRLYEGR